MTNPATSLLLVARLILKEADLDCSISDPSAEAFGAELDAAASALEALDALDAQAEHAPANWRDCMDALVSAIDADCGISSCSRERYRPLLDAYDAARLAEQSREDGAAAARPGSRPTT